MFDWIFQLDSGTLTMLLIAMFLVLAFEFINGFHDTANAVATVIYTHSMKPRTAVVASGFFNFLGVLIGGLAVAYTIVKLLPTDVILGNNHNQALAMVFALLLSAIIWNLGTWYLGLPASSSHTLIGSIIGVGMMHGYLYGQGWLDGVNLAKVFDVGLSLLLSPLTGCVMAGVLIIFMRRYSSDEKLHYTPKQRQLHDGKTHPPFWTRFMLVLSSMGVSFVHGSNDGQKGVGLLMLVLICIVPGQFALNLQGSNDQIEHIRTANSILSQTHQRYANIVVLQGSKTCSDSLTEQQATLDRLLPSSSFKDMSSSDRQLLRVTLHCLDYYSKALANSEYVTKEDRAQLNNIRKEHLTPSIEYAPLWTIIAVALAIGLGTMVGWKRVVLTVGEKIGKQGMTYAQGMAAQVTAVVSIGFANIFGLPVSTTQVLSSAVAGTMIADKVGVQVSTVRSIFIAWLLTLPVCITLSALLYLLLNYFIR
jgi:low-affinity inorganic phosphate transporter